MLDLFGFSLQAKMLIRLFIFPILFVLGALFLEILSGSSEDNIFKTSYLTGLSQFFYAGCLWLSLALFALFWITFFYASYRYWKWYNGDDTEICHVCGGMVTGKDGKYGSYYKCLACGTNRSSNR